jgi:radical SAM superfamily enzyme
MNDAGLNRIHIGMESGSDKVLKMVRKGSNKEQHVVAGQKVKAAGMELSEYVMPGLGGKALSADHALETADALNRIDADFIRFRTLAIRGGIPLRQQLEAGEFEKLTDVEVAGEIRQFIASLDGITSRIKSDHILNLFEEIDGQMPAAKQPILDVLDTFLQMSPDEQMFFQVGRRLGMLRRLDDMRGNGVRDRIDAICRQNGITPDNVEEVITELMKRFI